MPLVPGIYTPSPTFFKADLKTIDFQTQIAHTKFLQKNGIEGVVLMGSTGENAHLTRTERHQLIQTIHENVPGFPILAGIASNSVEDTLLEIESAKDAGASHAMVLCSNYFGASISQGGILDFYTEVCDKSVLPVLIYIYPGVTNNLNITAETLIKLSEHQNVVGCKLSHADVSFYTKVGLNSDIISGKNSFQTFVGLGQLLLPALTVGAVGTVDAISGAFPKIYVDLFRAYQRGDLEKARTLQLIITNAEEMVVQHGVIGVKKAIKLSTGLGETHLGRAPLSRDLTDGLWESTVQGFFDEIKAADSSVL